jgi:hypothetical protein
MLNRTTNNIEAHPRNGKTNPETPYRNKKRPQETNRNPELHSQKIFSALIVHPLRTRDE